jgi:hypothetical protein
MIIRERSTWHGGISNASFESSPMLVPKSQETRSGRCSCFVRCVRCVIFLKSLLIFQQSWDWFRDWAFGTETLHTSQSRHSLTIISPVLSTQIDYHLDRSTRLLEGAAPMSTPLKIIGGRCPSFLKYSPISSDRTLDDWWKCSRSITLFIIVQTMIRRWKSQSSSHSSFGGKAVQTISRGTRRISQEILSWLMNQAQFDFRKDIEVWVQTAKLSCLPNQLSCDCVEFCFTSHNLSWRVVLRHEWLNQ